MDYGRFDLNVIVDGDWTASEYAEAIMQDYAEQDEDMKAAHASARIESETIGSAAVYKVITDFPVEDVPFTRTDYIFEKNGSVYVLSFTINTANRQRTAASFLRK